MASPGSLQHHPPQLGQKLEAVDPSPSFGCYSLMVMDKLAGMVGFEPTVHCTKNSCLTTWLHPNVGG